MKREHDAWFFWTVVVPPLVWAALIFIGSSIPSRRIPDLRIFGSDKLLHASVYFVLAFLTHRALRMQVRFAGVRQIAAGMTLFLCAAYGISDEIHQHYTPGRSVDIFDWLADLLGILLYFVAWRVWQAWRSRLGRRSPAS